jgi:hypothetical protein
MSDVIEDLGVFETAKREARDAYQTWPLLALIKEMCEYSAKKEALEDELKVVNARYDVLRLEAIPERMDADGVENMKVEGIGRVSLTADLLVSVRGGAKESLFGWFRDNGLSDMIQPTVNASTLKAFVKGRMKGGKSVPEEFLNVTPITRASITKG